MEQAAFGPLIPEFVTQVVTTATSSRLAFPPFDKQLWVQVANSEAVKLLLSKLDASGNKQATKLAQKLGLQVLSREELFEMLFHVTGLASQVSEQALKHSETSC